jgi:hypothetical protein
MLTAIDNRVIGRNGNIVLVDFSRGPPPPAPRFPGASGLREPSCADSNMSLDPLAGPAAPGLCYAASSGARRPG